MTYRNERKNEQDSLFLFLCVFLLAFLCDLLCLENSQDPSWAARECLLSCLQLYLFLRIITVVCYLNRHRCGKLVNGKQLFYLNAVYFKKSIREKWGSVVTNVRSTGIYKYDSDVMCSVSSLLQRYAQTKNKHCPLSAMYLNRLVAEKDTIVTPKCAVP